MNNTDQYVDAVYAELERLYGKDNNIKKGLLGNEPMKTIFNHYSEWLANNLALSPKVAANAIYKDVIKVGYFNFMNKGLKKGIQLKGEPGFNLIYGSQSEIDEAVKMLTQIKNQDQSRYNLILTALEKVKALSDQVKPAKNIFGGRTTNQAKSAVKSFKLPTYGTLETFLKMSNQQLGSYILQLNKSIK